MFCIKWLSGMQEFSVLFSVRLAVWYAGKSCCFVSNGCLVCRNFQCCLVSDWLSGMQEDYVVLYQMAVWYAGIFSVV